MKHSAAFHLGIHFCISTGLGVPQMHRANITSGDKNKYFALQETYRSYRGGKRVSPSNGRNSSPAPDFPLCLSACLSLCCLFVACLCLSDCLFVFVRPSVRPSYIPL